MPMQKVVGSSPIIRSQEPAGNGGFFFKRGVVDRSGQPQIIRARPAVNRSFDEFDPAISPMTLADAVETLALEGALGDAPK